MSKYCFLFLFSVSLLSCQSEKNRQTDAVPLSHKVLLTEDDLLLGRVKGISLLRDSILVILDTNSDGFLHWINVSDKRVIGESGTIGQGPDDFLFVSAPHVNTDGRLVLFDLNKRRCMEQKDCHTIRDFELRFQSDSLIHFEVLPVCDSCYITMGYYPQNRFCLLDAQGNILRKLGEYPYRDEEERKVSGFIRSEIYQGALTANPSGTRFVQALSKAGVLSFYAKDLEDGAWNCVKEIQDYFPEYKYNAPAISASSPVCYLDVCANEDYVYALYSGKNYEEDGDKAFSGRIIEVYDWDGNLLKKYCSDVDLKVIEVTDNSRTLYAVGYNPDPIVVEIDLPEW